MKKQEKVLFPWEETPPGPGTPISFTPSHFPRGKRGYRLKTPTSSPLLPNIIKKAGGLRIISSVSLEYGMSYLKTKVVACTRNKHKAEKEHQHNETEHEHFVP